MIRSSSDVKLILVPLAFGVSVEPSTLISLVDRGESRRDRLATDWAKGCGDKRLCFGLKGDGVFHRGRHSESFGAVDFGRLDVVSKSSGADAKVISDAHEPAFVWSACSLVHLGSLSLGEQVVYNSLACLKPGGIAIHTTEFNVSSNDDTIDHHGTVIFRRCDMERIAENLTAQGQTVEPFAFDTGDLPVDQIVDAPPYTKDRHLKLLLHGYTCTSVGLIVRKTSEQIPQAPRHVTPRSSRDAWRPMRAWIKGRVNRLAEAVTPQRGVA